MRDESEAERKLRFLGYKRRWREANREQENERRRLARAAHRAAHPAPPPTPAPPPDPLKLKAQRHAAYLRYKAKHGEAIRERNRLREARRLKERIEADRAVYLKERRAQRARRISNNPDRFAEQRRAERQRLKAKDPARFLELKRASNRRCLSRPERKLSARLASAISKALARPGRVGKGGRSWVQLLGYDAPTLRAHLERQFLPGMTWENYGTAWHIDHILPASTFNVTGPDCPELRACWALSNLRPLWAPANMAKSAKRLTLL